MTGDKVNQTNTFYPDGSFHRKRVTRDGLRIQNYGVNNNELNWYAQNHYDLDGTLHRKRMYRVRDPSTFRQTNIMCHNSVSPDGKFVRHTRTVQNPTIFGDPRVQTNIIQQRSADGRTSRIIRRTTDPLPYNS